jgi:hypothetical protein
MTKADFDAARDLGDRYWGINPSSYGTHKTIEVRLHSGSTNFTKLSNWVRILVNIAHVSNKYRTDVDSAEKFCDRLGLNDDMLAYIKERMAKFKDKDGQHITVDEAA